MHRKQVVASVLDASAANVAAAAAAAAAPNVAVLEGSRHTRETEG